MDREKSKRRQNIRIIATNIFMSISVVVIVFVLMLVAMGFTFTENGKLEQAGLVQLASRPSDAVVEIDHESQFNHTELSKMLSAGNHLIKISKQGYDSWERDLKIDAGLLTRVDWIRLFPYNPTISNMRDFNDLRFATFSANRKNLIVAEKNNNTLYRIDIQDDNAKVTELPLNECLSTTADNAIRGTISIIAWNEPNNRFVAKWTIDDTTSWHLVDLEHPENSINLSKKFNLAFDSILITNNSASKLWALENTNLRIIDVNNLTISSAIASNIKKIAHNYDAISFVNIESDQKRHLNVYKDGDEGYTSIATLDNVTDETTVKLAMGTHWGEEWLAYSIDKDIHIVSGKYPIYGKSNAASSLKPKLDRKLEYIPQLLSINANQRIIVFSGDKYLTSYDIETKNYYDAELDAPLTNISWLDGFLVWQNIDNTIIVRDFDGSNRRKIISDVDNPFPVVISENNKWLYYFDVAEKETANDAKDKTLSDSDPVSSTKTTLRYTLKREKLQY